MNKRSVLCLCLGFAGGLASGILLAPHLGEHAIKGGQAAPVSSVAAENENISSTSEPSRDRPTVGVSMTAPPVEKIATVATPVDSPGRRAAQLALNRAGLLTELDRIYAPVFKRVKLTPERMAQLRRFLAERESIPYLASVAAESEGGETDLAMMETIRQKERDSVTNKIKTLLTPEEMQALSDFDNHREQYTQVEAMSARFNALHIELSPVQEKAVAEVIAKVEPDALAQPAWGASKDEWEKFLQKRRSLDAATIDTLKGVLSPQQVEAVIEYYGELRLPLSGLRDMATK